MSGINQSSGYFPLIQALRGFAALCIVITHALLEAGVEGSRSAVLGSPTLGEVGVDIFFVISGFIMVVVSADSFQQKRAPISFVGKRLARIVPLYWLLSLLLIGVILVAPGLVDNPDIDPVYWLKSLLFIPVEHPAGDGIRPVLVVGWTLQFELFFYALFALVLFLPRNLGLSCLLLMLVAIWLFGQLATPANDILRFFSNSLLLEFAAGVVIGWLFLTGFRLPAGLALPMVAIAAVSFVAGWQLSHFIEIGRAVYFGLPAAIMVAGVTLTRGAQIISLNRVWLRLGASSYALYLSHVFVVAALGALADAAGIFLWRDSLVLTGIFIMLSIGISIAVGWWLHILFELPANRYFRKILAVKSSNRKASSSVAVKSSMVFTK